MLNEDCYFKAMFDAVHVDEKWFNKDKYERAYFMLKGKVAPSRRRKSKRFIPKTMFLGSVVLPDLGNL